MKIQVSKVFADFINKTVTNVEASVRKMSENEYRMHVGSFAVWDAEQYGDYDWQTGKFKAIVVLYPSDYYACPLYITTKELHKEFERRGVKDADGLKSMIKDMIEI